MEKLIEFDGYTVAVIKKMYANGDCLCDVRQEVKTEKTDTTDESIQIVKSDTDIVFSKPYPFELTAEDLEMLNPKQIEQPRFAE